VDALDEVTRIEQVGLAGARPAAAHVDPGDRTLRRREHDRGAGQRPVSAQRGMPDPQPSDVREGVSLTDPGH
jgi:hypothetical protein